VGNLSQPLQPKPASPAAGSKVLLLAGKGRGGLDEAPRGCWARKEIDVHAPGTLSLKLDLAVTCAGVGRGSLAALPIRDQRGCEAARRPFGEYACLGRSHARHIPDRIHTREARLE
jgi:hypothetical protein